MNTNFTHPFDLYDRLYLNDYYGVNTKKSMPKNTYEGGWLPELDVTPEDYSYYSQGGPIVQATASYAKQQRLEKMHINWKKGSSMFTSWGIPITLGGYIYENAQ